MSRRMTKKGISKRVDASDVEWIEIVKGAAPRKAFICGVYFLINGLRIAYVGQSQNVYARLHEHHRKKTVVYDRYYIIECDRQLLLQLEAKYIMRYMPKGNLHKPYGRAAGKEVAVATTV